MRFWFMLLVLVLVGCGDCPDCEDCVDALDVPDAAPPDAVPPDARQELNLCHPLPVEWECDDGECIVGAYRCNGYRDCAGGEDEEECPDVG